MVESSKILTVSYGTFSCTLEGFDDSFGTMKAIAEYFRDLAADDRYFGAEPPTPDVQMLAKIAEREITRRVEARTEDGEIVLRADASPAPAMPPQAARPDPVQAAAAAVVPQPTEAEATPSISIEEFAETDDATASDVWHDAGPEAEETSSPLVASGQAIDDTIDTPDETPADSSLGHHDAESIAAKLERIRAVVGKSETTDDTLSAEDGSADLMPEIADIPEDLIADHEDHADAYDALVTAEEKDEIEAQPEIEDIATEAPAYEDEDPELAAMADGPDLSELFEEDTNADADIEMSAEEVAPSEVSEEMAEVDPEIVAPLVLTSDDAVSDVSDDDAMLAGMMDKLEAETTEEAVIAPTIVDPVANDTDDEQSDAINLAMLDGADEVDIANTSDATSLSDEQEQELMAELAELEREFGDDDQPQIETSADADDEPASFEVDAQDDEPAAQRNRLPETDDETMSHILSQTDEALNEPEGSRRRNAIAQLKAAVVATEAARSLGDKEETVEEAQEPFREDLNEVVRPKRPSRPTKATGRTERPRPAPLKLVASQRIDTDQEATETPVQPRRVASARPVVSKADASSFAEFADQMGAQELPDLLEAAAAYTAFVEGNEDFSRPQIMQKVQSTVDGKISREDGLRYFGTLLREGRISKVRSGRFSVAEDTRYRPSA